MRFIIIIINRLVCHLS